MGICAIELFSGVGMLGEGLRAGLAHLGVAYRTACHVEREAYAGGVLAARMEESSMDAAPVWSDVCTFDAGSWRGRVDCVVAGFPCQDLSVAGRRAGLDGKRSGLFFEVVRIATDSGAWLMLLENVAGIASATATVVDEAEGELDERAAARVVGELADLGWDAEWITLSASDVGASHGRARWFCLAWRVADAGWDGGNRLDWENGSGRRVRAAGDAVDGFERAERRSVGARIVGAIQGHHAGRRQAHGRVGVAVKVLEQPARIGRQERRPESAGQQGRPDAALNGGAVADTSQSRLPQPELTKLRGTRGRDERRAVEQRCSTLLFAPGPADASWAGILAEHPHLAPALEPTFRSVVDGLAFDMGDSRAARLRCVGNGVVALCAATAVVVLVRRACLFVAQSVPKEVVMTDTALTRYASTGEQAHAAILAAEVLL